MTRSFFSTVLLVAVLLGAGAGGVTAQTTRGELKGVSGVKFRIVNLSENSQLCGLGPEALQEAFTRPLIDAGLEIVGSSGYWAYIRVTTAIHAGDLCVTYADATLLQNTRYFNSATLSERAGRVEHWSEGALRVSDSSIHGKNVERAFRQFGLNLAELWRKDQ